MKPLVLTLLTLAPSGPAAGDPVAACLADADAQAQECREAAWGQFWSDIRRMPAAEVIEQINEDLRLCGLRREIRRELCLSEIPGGV